MGASGPQARRVIRPSVLIPGGLFKLPVPEATADKTFRQNIQVAKSRRLASLSGPGSFKLSTTHPRLIPTRSRSRSRRRPQEVKGTSFRSVRRNRDADVRAQHVPGCFVHRAHYQRCEPSSKPADRPSLLQSALTKHLVALPAHRNSGACTAASPSAQALSAVSKHSM